MDMFHNIMAKQQSMMRAINSLQADQRNRPQGAQDTLDTPSSTPQSTQVKHSSELEAPLHNISDISDERVEEEASTNDPVTEFWGQ